MAYVGQLLPDELQAQVLQEAMQEWLDNHGSDDDNDANNDKRVAMMALYSKFMNDWHKHNVQEKQRH
jgi:hypothetical protein